MAYKEFITIPGIRQEVEHHEHHAEADARHAQHKQDLEGLSRLRVQAPPATVVVEPGGKSFRTIKEANDSITDAGPTNLYMMNCGIGSWEEQVILKPYVHLTGSLDPGTEEPLTYLRCQAFKPGTAPVGGIVAASNSSITQCLIISYALEAGVNAVGIGCDSVNPFTIGNCSALVYNEGFALNAVAAISIDFVNYSKKGTSTVWMEYVNATINVPDTDDYPVALGIGGKASVTVNEGTLTATARDHAAGVVAFDTSNIRLNSATVKGSTWSLLIWGNSAATITADRCTLTGPVDPRVKIIG
ncbi:MAG TPA: hypothetical protein VF698_05735 [Thermoanaerobaculia bacterium]|jgi:hypothetical protein